MPRFHVRDTFTVEGRPHFVLAGEVVEGTIRTGMWVHVRFNASMGMTAQVDCIEFARRSGELENTCLCVRCADVEALQLWRGLKLGGENLEVTEEENPGEML